MKFHVTTRKNLLIPILFIHGFMKSHNDWNYCGTKKFNIEQKINKQRTTINIQFEIIDYLLPFEKVSNKICNFLIDNNIQKVIIVAHSIGGIYAKMLSKTSLSIHAIILIDSSNIDENFKTELICDSNTETNIIKKNIFINFVKYFYQLPSTDELKSKNIDIIFMLNINTKKKYFRGISRDIYDSEIIDTINYYKKIVKTWKEDNLIIFYNIGHMIHYKKFVEIIHLIQKY
jgi:hypothetical protein